MRGFSVEYRFAVFGPIVLEDGEQFVGQAEGAVAFAVFIHLDQPTARRVGADAIFGGDLFLKFAQPVRGWERGSCAPAQRFTKPRGPRSASATRFKSS